MKVNGYTNMVNKTYPSSKYKPAPGVIPHSPGVYRFLNDKEDVIYVGKAKFLDSRLSNYFGDPTKLHPRTSKMVETATSVTWAVCASETEALILEQSWIHQYRPRFNVAMKNSSDKYPSIAITMKDEFPRVFIWRGKRKKDVTYFGPYPSISTKNLLDTLLKVFPIRSCNANIFKLAVKTNKPCLLADIEKCVAPCVKKVTASEHKNKVKELISFLNGNHDETFLRLEEEMQKAAKELDFERAARRRDEIEILKTTISRQKVFIGSNLTADAIATFSEDNDSDQFGVAHVKVRNGNITGIQSWLTEKDPMLNTQEQMEQMLTEIYAKENDIAPLILLNEQAVDEEALKSFFAHLGSSVKIRVPKSGEAFEIIAAALRNAKSALDSGVFKRSNQIEDRAAALQEIGEVTGTGLTPWRMECIDIAHISGSSPVAAVTVFEDGLPVTNQYRKFNLPDSLNGDDFQGMKEAIYKRFGKTEANMRRHPDLLVVDGGQPQVQAALEAFKEIGLTDVMLVGLAKRLEELWLPDEDYPVILARNSASLLLLQHLRDEAHRFSNVSHRKRRDKKTLVSKLESVPGLGIKKQKVLLQTFGTVDAISSASVLDLQSVEGIGPKLAEVISKHLNN